MKRQSRFLITVFMFGSLLVVGCAGERPDAEYDAEGARADIEAVNARFETFVAQQQWDSLMTLYTEDAIFMPQGAPMEEGRAIRDGFVQMGAMGVTGLDLETIDVEVDGRTAYEVGRYTLEGPNGIQLDEGKYLVVWKNIDGEWKLHRDMINSDQPGPQVDGILSDTTAADTTMGPGMPETVVPETDRPEDVMPNDTSDVL